MESSIIFSWFEKSKKNKMGWIMEQIFTDPSKAWDLILEKLEQWGEGVILFLPNLVLAILAMMGFMLVSRIIYRLLWKLLIKVHLNYEMTKLIANIFYLIMLGVGIFISLGILELDKTVTSLLAGAGILGLALSFAFQNLATNFVSGIIISMRRPIAVGDIIKSNDFYGTVHNINWRTVHLITFEGQYIHIPNKELIEKPVENFTKLGRRRVDLKVGVSYGEDLQQVKDVVLDAVNDVPNRIESYDPELYYEEFNDSSIDFVVRFWIPFGRTTPNRDYKAAVSEAIMRIKLAFDREGITIPWPIRTLDFGAKGGQSFAQVMDQHTFKIDKSQ